MKGYRIFRLACLTLLWLLLCYLMVVSQKFTLRVAFIIIASGIVVFVPLYKKYLKTNSNDSRKK